MNEPPRKGLFESGYNDKIFRHASFPVMWAKRGGQAKDSSGSVLQSRFFAVHLATSNQTTSPIRMRKTKTPSPTPTVTAASTAPARQDGRASRFTPPHCLNPLILLLFVLAACAGPETAADVPEATEADGTYSRAFALLSSQPEWQVSAVIVNIGADLGANILWDDLRATFADSTVHFRRLKDVYDEAPDGTLRHDTASVFVAEYPYRPLPPHVLIDTLLFRLSLPEDPAPVLRLDAPGWGSLLLIPPP